MTKATPDESPDVAFKSIVIDEDQQASPGSGDPRQRINPSCKPSDSQ
jgi:hypothetical protein